MAETLSSSPMLKAKKAERDAKRKRLQAMFDQHKENEVRTSPQAPPYASYQNAQPDLEAGDKDNAQVGNSAAAPGHVVWMGSNAEAQPSRGELLREQAQSLIHMVDDRVERRSVLSQGQQMINDPAALWQKIQDNPRSFLGTVFLFFLLYWWL